MLQVKDMDTMVLPENSHTSISILPKDVIYHIFLIVADELKLENVHHATDTVRSLSQVCGSWRDLALSLSSLWCAIDCDKGRPGYIDILLQRSRDVPLRVSARPREEGLTPEIQAEAQLPSPNLKLVLPHLNRIVDLYVDCSLLLQSGWDSLVAYLLEPAPLLEALNLYFFHQRTAGWGFEPRFHLPEELFHGDAPRLKGFHLSACLNTFDSSIYRSLTALSIFWCFNGEGMPNYQGIPSTTWISKLRAMPLLERLVLDEATGTGMLSDYEKVQLPCLQYLELKDGPRECRSFLEHLILPRKCDIKIICYYVSTDMALQRFLQSLFLKLSQESSQMTVEFGLRYGHLSLTLQLSELAPDFNQQKSSNLLHGACISVTLVLRENDLTSVSGFVFTTLDAYVPRIEVLALHTAKSEDISQKVVRSVLHKFGSAVRYLSSDQGIGLFYILSLLVENEDVLLPELHGIKIKGVELTMPVPTSADDPLAEAPSGDASVENQTPITYDGIEFSLRSRSAMGYPIKDIEFHECLGVVERITSLSKIGLHVIWDGMEGQDKVLEPIG